ncbi:MAG: LegC family aminotransferase [Alphaproteobacteria bacterium]|nr:LegC family aminotransferase [Alphaproteobacteria bacterium]
MSRNAERLAQAVLDAVRTVIPDERPVPLHAPEIGEAERECVLKTLDSQWISSSAGTVDDFESMLADYTGAQFVVSTVNGTAALHLALLTLGIGPGDEVIVPALTFVATANAVAHCGAVPHFADSEPDSLGLDPDALEAYLRSIIIRDGGHCINRHTGRPIRAIVCTHIFGRPAHIHALSQVAEAFELPLVEDAAEALGSRVSGTHMGRFGKLGALSFNGNKIVTAGGGGAVMTDDPELAAKMRHIGTTARVAHRWRLRHDAIAYNYRMPSLNAAMGLAQMARLEGFLSNKNRLLARYVEAFSAVEGVSVMAPASTGVGNNWLIAAVLDEPSLAQRDAILDALVDDGIHARPVWDLLHGLPMYAQAPRMALPVAERMEAALICLPSSPILGEAA